MGDATVFIGEWLPDQAQSDNPGVNTAMNVLPLTQSSYTPVSQFARSATSPLPSAPLGAFSTQDNSGDAAIYTGTATDLYILTSSSKPNFSKVSSSSGVYSVPAGASWSFENFAGSVYAANISNPIQSAPAANGATNFSTVDTNAPKAACIAAIEPGFLLCLNINDVTLGVLPAGVRWSALGAASNGNWPLVGSQAAISAESDGQNVFGNIGQGRAIAPNLTTCNAALFYDKAVKRMIYTGDSNIFVIQDVEKLRGTPAGNSVVSWGQVAYFLGHDGFYSFDGTIALPIGFEKVDRWFFTDADPNYLSQVQGAVDPQTGLIYWTYAGYGNSGGAPNRILVYNPLLQRFSLIAGMGVSNVLVGLSIGIALDNITSQLGYSLDAIPYSLDSAILAGGNLVLGGFDSDFYFGFFTGANAAFQVETTEKQFLDGRHTRIRGVRPLVEGDVVSAAVGVRNTLNAASVYGSATTPNRDGICAARAEARYQRVMLAGAAGNMVTHVRGAKLIGSQGGSR